MKRDWGIINWLLTGCLLIFLMVVIGGITRLTHSGLSMVEWDLVIGTIPPLSESQWIESFRKYQQTPEFQKINYHFGLDEYKSIFWWEYIHRLIGRLIGLVFLIPFLYFLVMRRISRKLLPRLLMIFALGGFQGFLGWYMVKSGLVDVPYVSHYRLAIHLVAAFTTFAFTLWVALDLIYANRYGGNSAHGWFRKAILSFLVILGLQIVYGAFVAGLKAGFVYNTWPKMGDQWIADGVTAMEPFYLNFLEGLAGVQFLHRTLAYLLVVIVAVVWYKSRKTNLSDDQRFGINLLTALVLLQVVLGIFTLISAVPVWLGVTHQAVALLLLGANIFLIHRFRKGPEVVKIDRSNVSQEISAGT